MVLTPCSPCVSDCSASRGRGARHSTGVVVAYVSRYGLCSNVIYSQGTCSESFKVLNFNLVDKALTTSLPCLSRLSSIGVGFSGASFIPNPFA